MAEWKTLESEQQEEAEETRNRSVWIRLGAWLLRTWWAFVAGNALAILYFALAVVSTPYHADNSALVVVLIGLAAYPLIVGFVVLAWLATSAWVPDFGRQGVQAVVSLALCAFVALAIGVTNPFADRRPRFHEPRAEAMARPNADPKIAAGNADPKIAAGNAELERREREAAYGSYVPRAAPAPAPYVPRVEPRKPEDDYSKMPEIHVSRPGGDVLLTNHSTQVLRISAALMVPDGGGAPGCAALRAADGDVTGDAVVLKPRQAVTLRRRDACPGTEAAAVQLQVWNDQQQATPFRLIHER